MAEVTQAINTNSFTTQMKPVAEQSTPSMHVNVQDVKHRGLLTQQDISLTDAALLLRSGNGIAYLFADGNLTAKNFLGADFIALDIQFKASLYLIQHGCFSCTILFSAGSRRLQKVTHFKPGSLDGSAAPSSPCPSHSTHGSW